MKISQVFFEIKRQMTGPDQKMGGSTKTLVNLLLN